MGAAPVDHAFATAIVAVLAQPAAVVDGAGTILSCNSDFRSCLSITAGQVSGAALWTVLRANCGADAAAFFAAEPRQNMAFMTKVNAASGHFRLTLNSIAQTAQRGPYLCQLTPDIAIDSSRLRFLLEHLDQGVWNYNTMEKSFNVADAWRRMRGIPLSEDIDTYDTDHEKWLTEIHPEDRDMVQALFSGQVSGDKDKVNSQYRHWHPDGHWMWFSCRSKVMTYDDAGRPVEIVGVDTDITAMKKNETELLKLSSKLQIAIEAAGIGVWEFDAETGLEDWDERMLGMYGITDAADHNSGDIWETHLHPDDAEATKQYAQETFREKSDFNRDFRIVRDDGEVRHVRSLARFVRTSKSNGRMLGVNIDVTDDYHRAQELERARELLEHDSRHDALTGLANRRLLDETMQALLDRIGDEDQFAVLHIDLDHFKQINDTLGHAAGDNVLVRVSENLRGLVGPRGLVCRIGGDEFFVLLEHFADEAEVHQLCQDIIDQMAQPMFGYDQAKTFGLSLGCALGLGDVVDASEVFINADIALYVAKSDGRSCFKVFAPGLRAVTQIDTHAHHNLRVALTSGQIICHFQPQFDAKTHALVGAEALVRWMCPDRGLIGPDDFLPLARKTGLLPRIDDFVFGFVLEAQTKWAAAGLDVPIIALNISLERLQEPGLMQQISDRLQPHHAISFELLETTFLDTCDDGLSDTLNQLRAAGVRLEMNDFGSGRSSIVALQTVRPDRVKLDRMLLAPLETNPAQIFILKALARVAALEGCGVVVEGIESQKQLNAVLQLDCEALQGIALARPMAEAEFAKMLIASPGVS
ncbi:putative signaling protein with diguanylate cyclase activity [Octadecabacter antarcticus 307]|uniref:Putative signaling protein with diguanylate cyclase activity n=1 Tax=Octadecabacter antarcticus 307 TaxID=391626 RepID=M9R6X9_9RHOB|nr:EAL domain-containing protein [Octadecabacter antarcticus]AGI67962.1 putative signaling protein with diguanylate cyclase activity [Octadecabacter antarcticus 307]